MIGRLGNVRWRKAIEIEVRSYAVESKLTDSPVILRGTREESGTSSLKALATKLGVRTERLSSAVDRLPTGLVATKRTAAGRLRRVMSARAEMFVTENLRDEVSAKYASRKLWLKACRIELLHEAGVLETQNGKLSRRVIDELAANILANAMTTSIPPDAIRLSDALSRWIRMGDTCAFLDALTSREIDSYLRPGEGGVHVKDLFFSRKDLIQWTTQTRSREGDWMSLPEAARHLRLKQEVLYHLVSVGLIKTYLRNTGRREARAACVSELDHFRRMFQPLAALTATAGVGHRGALRWAQARGLQLVSGPPVDGGRQYFVKAGEPAGDLATRKPASKNGERHAR
jgi:hypothetical protein